MGRPKKEKPVDPILAAVVQAEPTAMPALSASAMMLGGNTLVITADLARGVRQLRFLDQQIAALNLQKSGIYGTLAEKGYTKPLVKEADRQLRQDPVLRAQKKAKEDAYVAALEAGLAALSDEDEQAEAAEKAVA